LIGSYGFSLAGRSHQAQSQPCQDAHVAVRLTETVWLAAVADGVGSAARSEVGSALAVSALADFCGRADAANPDWKAWLLAGFHHANEAIQSKAEEEQVPLHAYDTTLTAALYDGSRVTFGQSGDGGIIGMDSNGHYRLLTETQKGEAHNEVYPLRSGPTKCGFADSGQPYAGLLLLTDGILDVAVPALLADQPERLYLPFIRRFLCGETLRCPPHETDRLSAECAVFLQSPFCRAITDDMTALSIWNPHAAFTAPAQDYFTEPDWEMLRRIRFNRLYPQLAPAKENKSDDCQDQQL